MSNKIYADLIFKYEPVGFTGNNHTASAIAEALDGQEITLNEISFKPQPDGKIKVWVEIEVSYDDERERIFGEDDATEFLSDKVCSAGLPSCTVLIDAANTEFCDETDSERQERIEVGRED